MFDKRLILVVGKGGVGRSTVAASLALACAERGRRTLLFEANAKDRFGEFFGKPEVDATMRPLRENLWAVNTNPNAALEEYGMMVLRFRRVYKLVFENRLTKAFIQAIPGVEDYAILGKAWFHTQEEKRGGPVWDTVVFDMAASGHGLSMLRIPWAIMDTVKDGPLRRDALQIQELLTDTQRTGVVMVTLAEEMPTNEAIELGQHLQELGVPVQQAIVNQLYPDHFPTGSPQEHVLDALAATRHPLLAPLFQDGRQSRSRRRLNDEHCERLHQGLPVPTLALPRLFVPSLSVEEIEFLSRRLSNGLQE